jgi:hypothetical protein
MTVLLNTPSVLLKYLHKQPSASVLVVALLYTAFMYLGQHLPNSVHQSLNPNLLGG